MMDFFLKGHDVVIADGDLVLCRSDREVIAQAIVIRLKTIAGEWFLDTNQGVPYLTEIFGHKRSPRFIRHAILPIIEGVPGVHHVKDFTLDIKSDRIMSLSFTAQLNDGVHLPITESLGF